MVEFVSNNNDEINLTSRILTGNAGQKDWDNCHRGWFIGHFIDSSFGLRSTSDIEVKWGEHKPNEERKNPGVNNQSTTLTLLISGAFIIEFPDFNKSISLKKMGDYVIFGPGVSHTWKAIDDSIVLTVRWPSVGAE